MGHNAKKVTIGNPDESVVRAIRENLREGSLPCAVAFKLSETLGLSPLEIGGYADALSIRLVKCQMGLYGYNGGKKLTVPEVGAMMSSTISTRVVLPAPLGPSSPKQLPRLMVRLTPSTAKSCL